MGYILGDTSTAAGVTQWIARSGLGLARLIFSSIALGSTCLVDGIGVGVGVGVGGVGFVLYLCDDQAQTSSLLKTSNMQWSRRGDLSERRTREDECDACICG